MPGMIRRIAIGLSLTMAASLIAACSGSSKKGATPATRATAAASSTSSTSTTPVPTTVVNPAFVAAPGAVGSLAPGSDPNVLPAPLLIADRGNNRLIVVDPHGVVTWEFPRPGDLAPGQTFDVPDDAFFSPDGRQIIVTQEDDFVVTVIDVATHHIVWRYGTPGVHGSGPGLLWNPDDAMMLPDGTVLTADIKNCRILLIPPGGAAPERILGTTGSCVHSPPRTFGSPNGVFPMADGHYLVTEINGDWVDAIDLHGNVAWSTHPPGVAYPSDSNQVRPGVFITVDYSRPGQIVEFDQQGKALWVYRPTGAGALRQPSLAFGLPNGDVICNDDFNHRVIVVDPGTNRVVWQYGVTGQPGNGPGQLDIPDGMDLVPPYSLLVSRAASMGAP